MHPTKCGVIKVPTMGIRKQFIIICMCVFCLGYITYIQLFKYTEKTVHLTAKSSHYKVLPSQKMEKKDNVKKGFIRHTKVKLKLNIKNKTIVEVTPGPLDDILTKEIYESGFIVPQPNICPFLGKNVQVLLLVDTAPYNKEARYAIRETWGNITEFQDFMAIGYFVGVSRNESVNENVTKEVEKYSDIIQGAFIDSYDNLTLKTISMLEWTSTYCPRAKFLLKVDDDMIIDLVKLKYVVEKVAERDVAVYGRLARKWKPARDRDNKYSLSRKMYPNQYLPKFLTGPAYLIPGSVIENLYYTSLETKFLRLEDVFLTGIVAEKLNISRINLREFKNTIGKNPINKCRWSHFVSIHGVSPDALRKYWKRKSKCG